MNIFLWILQCFLALHTLTGAIWKFSNSEQTIPSLQAIPHTLWQTLIIVEIFCSLGFVLPIFNKSLSINISIAALCIAAEMLFFCGVHMYSDETNHSSMIYWLVIAAICIFVAYSRHCKILN